MFEKRSWSSLSPRWRTAVVIGVVVQYALLSAALWDLTRRRDNEVKGPRRLWKALVFVNFVGPLSYFRWGRR